MEEFSVSTYKSKEISDINILKITGELDIQTLPEVVLTINKLFSENNYKIIFDLSDLSYSNSAGVGIIVNTIKQARANNGEIKIASVNPDILYLFNLLGFTKIYKIYDSISDALNNFQKE